jgi:glycosyltransferase involved in cell wall biosynthesis
VAASRAKEEVFIDRFLIMSNGMARITLLHYSAPPVVGGVESVIAHQARLMTDDGHAVRVIAGRGEQFDPRVPFDRLPLGDSRHPDVLAVKAELDRGQVPPSFDELVSRIEPSLSELIASSDILIGHNVCSLHKNLALTAALRKLVDRSKRPRLILWHHDLAWCTPRYRTELHEGYPWDLLKQAWPDVTQVTVSELRRDELAELYQLDKEQIRVIPNGIETAGFLKLEEQTLAFVKQLNLLAAEPLLLLPVRITPRKNIELALRTLVQLRKSFRDAQLVVTGPLGPHNPDNVKYFDQLLYIRRELGLMGSAHFLAELSSDYIPDRVISDLYKLADALLLPSREEGFGLPILEAGLAGLPIFCADLPPLRKLGGEYAVYFSPDADPEEVAGLITKNLCASPVFGLRAAVKKNHSWERVYSEHLAPLLRL